MFIYMFLMFTYIFQKEIKKLYIKISFIIKDMHTNMI